MRLEFSWYYHSLFVCYVGTSEIGGEHRCIKSIQDNEVDMRHNRECNISIFISMNILPAFSVSISNYYAPEIDGMCVEVT